MNTYARMHAHTQACMDGRTHTHTPSIASRHALHLRLREPPKHTYTHTHKPTLKKIETASVFLLAKTVFQQ